MRDVLRAHPARDARAARRGRADALHRPPRAASPPALLEQMDWAEARPPATTASRCSSPSTTAAGRRSSTPPRATRAAGEEDVPRAAVRARDARPRPRSSARAASSGSRNYLLWQSRVLRARVPRRAVAGLHARGVRGGPGRVRARGGAGSAGADGDARDAAAIAARRTRGGASRARRAGAAVAVPAIAFAIFIVVQGGWVLRARRWACSASSACTSCSRCSPRPGPSRLAGFLGLIGLLRRGAVRRPGRRSCWRSWRRSRWCSCLALAQRRAGRRARHRGDAARPGLDRAGASPTPCCCATCRTATRSSSTCWSARSSATPAPTSAGGSSAGARWRRAISPNKTVEGLVIGIVAGVAAVWFAGLYQDWLTGTRGADPRRRRRRRRARRRPLRVATSSATRHEGHRARCSAPTAARWTASTPCCSPRSPATTSGSALLWRSEATAA